MDVDAQLVRRLIDGQFPQWRDLPIGPEPLGGWDNRSFRLGDEMVVRLPSAEAYAPQVSKEQKWLPVLGPLLPLRVPRPLAMGLPAAGYPWLWSVFSWLEGEPASRAPISDRMRFAQDLAGFLGALRQIDASGGPGPGDHNFHRGGPLAHYDVETRAAIDALGDAIDGADTVRAWEEALAAADDGAPRWLHGDMDAANLLVTDGALKAVIDFGGCGVGDPACDLAIAWTFFDPIERSAFRAGLAPPENEWRRGRGWALWKALILLAGLPGTDKARRQSARRTLGEVLADRGSGPN